MPKKRYLDNAGKQDYQDVIRSVANKEKSYTDRLGKADEILPYINSKARVLTNAGRATGANVSMNRLDSIAKYAGLVGLPITDAIGIGVKENTLGNPTENQDTKKLSRLLRNFNYPTEQSIDNGIRQWKMSDFINYVRGYERNPYTELFNNTDNGKDEEKLKAGLKYADNKAKDIDLRPFFQQGFEFYKNNPNAYNPGQSNYSTLVRKVGNEVFQSPEIKDWWDKSGYYWYNGFIDNGWDKVDYVKPNEIRVDPSTGEVVTPNLRGAVILPEVNIHATRTRRTLANGGGIHINPANRGKFTATMQRTGKTAEELSHSSNPLTRKRAIFALNARKWNH